MQSKRTTEESTDRGVSPVIGVILMVAITVILAAVIAAFVLDIGPGETDPGASVDVNVDGDDVDVTLNSLDGSADGVAVVEDLDDDESPFVDGNSGVLTISGDSESYTVDASDDPAVIAFSGDADDASGLDDVDNFAILDNLEEVE